MVPPGTTSCWESNDPSATFDALKRHGDGRVWLNTGDLGRRDADGNFYLRG
jgi:long-subunit acyl-CoA synthetase (AMP-forming)